jgi:hypothetical protein
VSRLIALYPRTWRERYGDEFLALLSERPPDPLDRIDIVRGAIDARLHPQPDPQRSPEPLEPLPYNGPWSIRRAGIVSLVGGFFWIATIGIAVNGPIMRDGLHVYRDVGAAIMTFLISVALLIVGLWAAAATLPSRSRVARTAALVAGLAGAVWAIAPWLLMFGAVMCLGFAILAIEAARTARWRRSDAAILVAGITASVAVVIAAVNGINPPVAQPDVQFVALLMLAPLWFATAHALLRPAIPVAEPVGDQAADPATTRP